MENRVVIFTALTLLIIALVLGISLQFRFRRNKENLYDRIKPKTKFLVYGKGDIVIMKKLYLPDMKKEWNEIFKAMEKKNLRLSKSEIQNEIAEVRKLH